VLTDVAAFGAGNGHAGCCVIAATAIVPQALRRSKLRRLPPPNRQGVLGRGADLSREYLRGQDVADHAEQQERRQRSVRIPPGS